ncbi:MAG: energy-coupling factor transporter transmembrane component T [Nitrospirota bacterium]|nr:energy-coupling factor transporter transmembrane component T [Nitrospirota bacterium]
MNISLYLDRQTFVHQFDGRTKVLGLLLVFVLALIFSDPWYLLGLMAGLLWLGNYAQVLSNVRRLWILLALLFVYSVLLWPWFIEGHTPLVMIGDHLITVEGVQHGVSMGLRLNVMLSSGLFLLSIMTIEEFATALQQLGVPRAMGFTFSLAFRWVPTLLGAVGTVVQAQQSRGLDLKSKSFLQKIRAYPPLVVPLIGHTLRQTNLLAMALESKGFSPNQPFRSLSRRALTTRDYWAWIGFGLILLACLWIRGKGYGTIS